MTYLMVCGGGCAPIVGCKGEGRRAQPPYDVNHPERKARWQSAEPCDECGGLGYRDATLAEITQHRQQAQSDAAA